MDQIKLLEFRIVEYALRWTLHNKIIIQSRK